MQRIFIDMTGHEVALNGLPTRIVSLVPSQTELLYDLGLGDAVVGITKFCVHPHEWFRTKTRIGGTKTVHLDKVRALEPDLILANKEENTREQVEALAQEFPVWISDIKTVDDALEMIRRVGSLTGRSAEANAILAEIEKGFVGLSQSPTRLKVAYFIWRAPWMVAGGDTFISDIITRLGWENVYGMQSRYPDTDLNQLAELRPDLILLSSEPYPFKDIHIAEIRGLVPDATIKLVDGEMFSWYGSRMLKAVGYFDQLAQETGQKT